MSTKKKQFGDIRHHYWNGIIATYLYLGGLAGGIYALAAICTFFVAPGLLSTGTEFAIDITNKMFLWPGFLAIVFLGIGCALLVVDLGQPLLFYRAFIKSTSVLAWGARFLSVCMIFGLLWFISYIPWDWFKPVADFFVFFRPLNLALAGIAGVCVMLYTGIFLSTLKAHSFWATPALPVLFCVSALSTGCACIALSMGWWPAEFPGMIESQLAPAFYEYYANLLHVIDIILVAVEVVVVLVMVLSFLGAGNVTANAAAHKWVDGSWKYLFWVAFLGCGLVVPELMYIFGGHGVISTVIAPILVLIGGLILRWMIIFTDERAPLPGEKRYYGRLVGDDAQFLHTWRRGENLF